MLAKLLLFCAISLGVENTKEQTCVKMRQRTFVEYPMQLSLMLGNFTVLQLSSHYNQFDPHTSKDAHLKSMLPPGSIESRGMREATSC